MIRDEVGPGFLGGLTRDTGDGVLSEVRTTSYTGGHNLGDIDYREDPPMGGEHTDFWHDCGVFDHPLYEEAVVQSLEHGTGVLSPRDGLPGDVVITLWNAQSALEHVDLPALEDFIDEYGDGHTAPEAFGSCEGGIEVTEDGLAVLPTAGA
jgi:hypothetical protein